ncbi:MAG: penicillin acylase family protein, partial [Rhodothermales bacterium]|nr:penicillin acylase family protein [Rhodothermales bacterium]
MTAGRSVGPAIAGLVVWGGLGAALLLVLGGHVFGLPPLGDLLDPADGLYRTARRAVPPAEAEVSLPALDAPVTVLLDDRGVPHIFASSDRDAVVAFGYVTARDRLFQLDFLPRVASGRLSELFGPASIGADRFLRRTGMELGARRNAVRIIEEDGIERRLVQWFADGVNAYVDALAPEDLPFEFRLLGVKPDRYTVLHAARLMQYFAYDLTYRTDVAGYGQLRSQLAPEDYALLYPHHSRLFVPIIPEAGGGAAPQQTAGNAPAERAGAVLARLAEEQAALRGTAAEGFVHGKGSNNWVVGGARSATGRPILAGDMHLRLTLPSIWYEAHLVSPSMNSYGVAAPGTPLPIEAFTEQLAWAFTNTGADVIDHYALDVDRQRMCYRYQDTCRPLEAVPDTIRVRGGEAVIDTLYYSHFGPVMLDDSGAVAVRWVAHDTSRTLQALWHMHHADDLDAFADALTRWDTPAQNIVQADTGGAIAIRSTGYLPIRRAGHGRGLLDGTGDAFEWIGRIPFEELPQSRNPDQGFLTSTNQQPADSTYPYYLGHDWRDSYRSLRIDTLLRARPRHGAEDLMAYQADVHAVQRDLFVPFLDTL